MKKLVLNEDAAIKVEDKSKIDLQDDIKTGISALLQGLIIDEWEAIDGYNSAIASIRNENDKGQYDGIIDILSDIATEEMVHVGQLQTALGLVSPNASVDAISDGNKEAEEQLDGQESEKPLEEPEHDVEEPLEQEAEAPLDESAKDSLEEGWNYRISAKDVSKLRDAIDRESYEDIKAELISILKKSKDFFDEVEDEQTIDEFDKLISDINDSDFADIDDANYFLDEFYDLMDAEHILLEY